MYDFLTERRVSSGVSRWDASGLFTDVASAPVAQRDLSPRTLLLLYVPRISPSAFAGRSCRRSSRVSSSSPRPT